MFKLGKDKKMREFNKTEIEKTVENLVQKSRENTQRLIQKSEDFQKIAEQILNPPQRTKLKKALR